MGGTLSSFVQFWQTHMSLALRLFLKLHLKKKKQLTNEPNRKTHRHRERLELARGGGRVGRVMG